MMVFCVEDDASIRDIEVYTLQSTGFEAEGFADSKALFAALAETVPALLLLDVMLPGEDGVSILRRLRSMPATRTLPIIMATAKGDEYDKVQSLDLGADDYLVKPFGMMEMISRVRAVLRRSAPTTLSSQTLQLGGLRVQLDQHIVTIDDARISLTLKEFDLLRVLLSHPGVAFTREQLLNDVWGTSYYGETRTVDVHVRTLRQKLGDYGALIETVRGVGYRLEESTS